ncbi:MAG: DUF1778 domain-containing protein [Lautropia sp.]
MSSTATLTERFALRLAPEDKARLQRAAAIEKVDLKTFLLRHALSAADQAIESANQITLSIRDSERLLDLLDAEPMPNDRLLAAAARFQART